MTENAVEAGRLFVEVVSDASGFRRDLKTKLDAVAQDLRVKVKAELNSRGLITQTRTAARDVSRAQIKVRLKADLDPRGLVTQARTAAKDASRAKVKVGVEFDANQVRRELRRALDDAAATVRANVIVNVTADTTRMRAAIGAARREQEIRPVTLRTTADTSGLARALSSVGGALSGLSLIPAIASGILVAAGAATNLAGALFSVVAAGSQAVGVLAALPGLIGVAAQGVGALVAGFSGIGKAVTALGKADQAGAVSAGRSATSQAASMEQIKAARERLADAQKQAAQNVADAEKQAARDIADAEKQAARQIASAQDSLQQSQRDEQRALEDLNRARKEAVEELQQLAFQTRDAALSEEQAEISLAHASAKVQQARQSAVISPLDRRQAELDYKQAILDLEEAKDKASDLEKQNKSAQKAGVEGTDTVRSAEQQLADAKRATAKAEKDLAEARRTGAESVARARASGAEAVARATAAGAREVSAAQRALQSALRGTAAPAAGATAGMRGLDSALRNLSPAGRRFAEFLAHTLLPRFRQLRNAVQEALLPGLQRGITRAMPLLNTIQRGLVGTGRVLGRLAIQAGTFAGSPLFRRDVATVMRANNVAIGHFGQAGLYLADALRHVLVVASPLLVRLSKLAEAWAKHADNAAKSGRETNRMADFFDRAWTTAGKLFRIVRDVAKAIFNLGKASTPSGDTLLDSLARGASNLRAWTADPANQTRIQAFFDGVVPVAKQFGDLLTRVVDVLVRLGNVTGGHSLDSLFAVLNAFLDVLTAITKIPGGGTVLSTILIVSGAGLGLGLVAKFLSNIVKNLGKAAKYTGVAKLFGSLTGGGRGRGRKTHVGQLADDVTATSTAIDGELPRDRKKSKALGDVGDKAKDAGKHTGNLATGLDGLGGKAEKSAVKSSRFARALGGLGRGAGRVLGPVGRLAGLLLRIPGVGTALSRIGGLIARAFRRIRLPRLDFAKLFHGAARGVGRAVSGLGNVLSKAFRRIRLPKINLGGLISGASRLGKDASKTATRGISKLVGDVSKDALRRISGLRRVVGRAWGRFLGIFTRIRLPSVGSVLGKIGRFLLRLTGTIGKYAVRILGAFIRKLPKILGKVAKGALKGGGGKFLGGPWGIIGSILVSILGDWIGGKTGGAISGAATGAGIGAFVGPIGAVVGAVIGALVGAFGSELKGLPGKILRGLLIAGSFVGAGSGRLGIGIGKWLIKQIGRFGPTVGKFLTKEGRSLIPIILRAVTGPIGRAFGGLGRTVTRLWGGLWHGLPRVANTALHSVGGFVTRSARAIGARFGSMARTVGTFARSMFTRFVSYAKTFPKTAVAWVGRHLHSIRTAFSSARTYVAGRARSMFTAVWTYAKNLLRSARDWVTRHLNAIRRGFNSARAYIESRWRAGLAYVSTKAKAFMATARNTISTALSKIRTAFSTAVSAIGRIWDGLKAKTKAPVSFLVNTVYMKGIRGTWEGVRRLVPALPSIPAYRFAQGGLLPQLSGILPGYTPGMDIWQAPLAAFSGGEAIMRPEWARAVGRQYIEAGNSAARRGKLALAKFLGVAGDPGGVTDGFHRRRGYSGGGIVARFADGGILGRIKSVLKKPIDLARAGASAILSKGASAFAKRILDPILRQAGSLNTGGLWGKMVAALPKRLIEGFVGFLKKVVDPNLGGGATAVVRAARSQLGKPYSWGGGGTSGASFGIGRGSGTFGFDCSGLTEYAWWKGAHKEIGGTTGPQHAGSTRISGPRPGALAFPHSDHVMLGSDRPGYIIQAPHTGAFVEEVRRSASDWRWPRNAAKLDTGGWIRRGLNMIVNGTRRREFVLSPQAIDLLGGERAVEQLNAGARLRRSARATTPVRGDGAPSRPSATVNVYPREGQSEHEIGVIAARKIGQMVR